MNVNLPAFPKASDPAAVARIARAVLANESELDQAKEHLWILGVDAKLIVRYMELVHLGGLDQSICDPRSVFRYALTKDVSAILLVHNHPSGTPDPSADDHTLTRRIQLAGELLEIRLLDHVIIGTDSHYSAKEAGKL